MTKKRLGRIPKMSEAAWLIGIVLCALGVALSTKTGFGLSMVAAPPYIIHVMVSNIFPWFSHGMSEYLWQALQLLIMCIIVRSFKVKFLLSFVTAVVYGVMDEGALKIVNEYMRSADEKQKR